jgi:tetratricopeptide (TPR) repeat protein
MKSYTLSLFLLTPLLATGASAQAAPTLQPTSLSRATVNDAAAAHFQSGMAAADYNFPAKAAEHFGQAAAASPGWGIARVMNALYAPELDRAARIVELNRGVADAAGGTTLELLAALTYRERFTSGAQAARPLARALSEMAPDNPTFAMVNAFRGGLTEQERIAALQEVANRFPTYGAPHNLIAYDRWRLGDRPGALQAAETQVRLTPNQPNAHDTYAEILQWAGRFDDAGAHYQHALDRAPDFIAAHVGLAEIDQLQQRGGDARERLAREIARTTDVGDFAYLRVAVANSYLADGRLAEAQGILAELAGSATTRGDSAGVSGLHVRMAVADAFVGNGRAAEGHLSQASSFGRVDDFFATLVHALTGHPDLARASAAAFAARMQANRTAAGKEAVHAVAGFARLAENDCAGAAAEWAQTSGIGVVGLGRVLCMERTGKGAEARALRAELATSGDFDLSDYALAAVHGRMRGSR